MAITLQSLRDKIITSIHGKRLGFDSADNVLGFKGIRQPVTAATSASTGTNLPAYGHVTISSSSARTWNLAAGEVGTQVSISSISTSTLGFTITATSAQFQSTGSSTGPSVVLTGGRAGALLTKVTTGLWVVAASNGTTGVVHVNT